MSRRGMRTIVADRPGGVCVRTDTQREARVLARRAAAGWWGLGRTGGLECGVAIVASVCAVLAMHGCAEGHRDRQAALGVGVNVDMQAGGVHSQQVSALAPLDGSGATTPAPGAAAIRHISSTNVFQTQEARVVNTLDMPNKPEVFGVATALQRRLREVLPPHERPMNHFPTDANARRDSEQEVAPAAMLEEDRAQPLSMFPGAGQTEWRPPDPTLAVGPSHIVTTVNMALAIHDKQTGDLQFAVPLNDYGDPGLFETVGGSWFTFDPKCFYDHFAQRFVVVALETYSEPFGTWINIAVSDDSDPHGTWYVYRTDASIQFTSAWWDYPGFGYDSEAWYVTGNLIGGSGAGFRIFNKTPMLSGQPAEFATLTSPNTTVQAAQHFGSNQAGFFATITSGQALGVLAIRNPLTTPTLVTAAVSIPTFSQPVGNPPTPTDTISNLTGNWAMNACWRDGMLYTTHVVGAQASGRAVARWYQVATNNWPASGAPTLVQSGVADPGADLQLAFPSIYVNANNDVALLANVTGPTTNPGIAVTGRAAGDAPGTMGRMRIVHTGSVGEGGRWGDYTDLAVDPVDGLTFWGIGEYKDANGWNNWITSFAVTPPLLPVGVSDDAGVRIGGVPVTIAVLNNDYAPPGRTLSVMSVSPTSVLGGSVERLANNTIRYTPPASTPVPAVPSLDSFTYTLSTDAMQTATGVVHATVFDPSRFRWPGTRTSVQATPRVRFYALGDATGMPEFAGLTAYATETATPLIASTLDTILTSGRSDQVGAVFDGWITAPTTGLYSVRLTANEGARLFLNGRLEVDNSGPNSSEVQKLGFVALRQGTHHLRVEYYELLTRAGLSVTFAPAVTLGGGTGCDSIDFNGDGSIFDPIDLAALFSVYSEGPCVPAEAACADIDFNNDDSIFDPCDIASYLTLYAEGPCTPCGQ